MLTYQDYEAAQDKEQFLLQAIEAHKSSQLYRTAKTADLYDHQKNETINNYVKTIFLLSGIAVEDFTASNAKIASNFFHRLNTQRCTYSLGNGVTFSQHVQTKTVDGKTRTVDETNEKLGQKFDTDLKRCGYFALIHGLCFGYWNVDRLHCFKITESAPLWDEDDGRLRALIRFWQLADDKPMSVTFYTEEGFTRYKTQKAGDKLTLVEKKGNKGLAYKRTRDSETGEVVGEDNYNGKLPIFPLWGSPLHQSTLVGMQQGIDSYDLIRSGFANDLQDVSQIYWIVENCGGMKEPQLAKFRDQLRTMHIANVNTQQGGKVTPHTQEIPHEAREKFLNGIRSDIYENFGGLDVHTVSADSTNDHLEAAYQPLDEEADDFEYELIEFVQQILALMGIEDTPVFKRNRISNQKEQTEMLVMVRDDLDRETFLKKLPMITPDEVVDIMTNLDAEEGSRYKEDNDGENKPIEKIEEVEV